MSSPSANLDNLFNIGDAIEEPLRTLVAAKVSPNTPRESAPVYDRRNGAKMDKEKARVEIQFRNGETTGHQHVIDAANNVTMYDAWRGQIVVQIITPTSEQSMHGLWVSYCRQIMAGVIDAQTEELFPYHSLNYVMGAGDTPTIHSKDGFFATTLTYAVHVSIRAGAWPTN